MTDKKALEVLKSWLQLAYQNADGTDECCAELYEALQTVFALINQQQAEIERLNSVNDEKFRQWDMLAEKTKQHYADLYEEARDILKVEAYKEFVSRLKCGVPQETGVIRCSDVDKLVKEMVGEKNDKQRSY